MTRAAAWMVPWLMAMTMTAQAAEIYPVARELWEHPRTARAVLGQPAIRQALNVHLSQPGSRLVIYHDYGQEPLLHAEELRAWLMALAVSGTRISLVNDVVPKQPLRIEVVK